MKIGLRTAALCLALLCASTQAEARRIALFVRTQHPGARSFAAFAQAVFRRTLAATPGVDVAELHENLEPAARNAREQRELKVAALLEEAQQSMAERMHEDAERAANQAIELLRKDAEHALDLGQLVRAHQAMAAALFALDREDEAESHLRKSVALAPRTSLADDPIGDALRTRHEALAAEARKTRVSIEASSTPAGATLIVDGTPLGLTPAKVQVEAPGEHVLQFRLDGFEPDGTFVTLDPRTPSTFRRSLRPIPRAQNMDVLIDRAMEQAGIEELVADDAILELGTALQADEMILARVLATRETQVVIEAFHYDFLDGQLANSGDRIFAPGSRSVQADLQQFGDDLLAARTELSLRGTLALAPIPEGARFTTLGQAGGDAPDSGSGGGKAVWLWVGIGTAAVAAAGTAAVLLLGSAREDEPSGPGEGQILFGFE